MSRSRIPKALRAKVAAQARYRCGYCLTAEPIVGTSMELDHLIPEALGGLTEEDLGPREASLGRCGLAPTQRLTLIRPPHRHAMEAEGKRKTAMRFLGRECERAPHARITASSWDTFDQATAGPSEPLLS